MKLQLGTFHLTLTNEQWIEVEKRYNELRGNRRKKQCGMLSLQPIASRGTITVTVLTQEFSEKLLKYLKRCKTMGMNPPPDKEDSEWLSVCCGVAPLGEMGEVFYECYRGKCKTLRTGLCSKCKDHTTFEKDQE